MAGVLPFLSDAMDERHWLVAVRYVARNPVDVRFVKRAEDWEWSSARYHLGISPADRLVRERNLFGLANDWREYLTGADGHDNTNYELHLRTGRPSGSTDFLDQLEQLIGTSLRRKKGGGRRVKKEMKYTVPGNSDFPESPTVPPPATSKISPTVTTTTATSLQTRKVADESCVRL